MIKDEILNDKTLWKNFNKSSINEFMKFENRGRKIMFLLQCNSKYIDWYPGYCINKYLYYDNKNKDLIPFNIIKGWQWIENIPI